MKSFNVIVEDNGKFIPYDIMPYLVRAYNEEDKKPNSFDEYKEFIERKARYMYWSRCEYEIILVNWPGKTKSKKIDVFDQIMMNIDIVTEILMEYFNKFDVTYNPSDNSITLGDSDGNIIVSRYKLTGIELLSVERVGDSLHFVYKDGTTDVINLRTREVTKK